MQPVYVKFWTKCIPKVFIAKIVLYRKLVELFKHFTRSSDWMLIISNIPTRSEIMWHYDPQNDGFEELKCEWWRFLVLFRMRANKNRLEFGWWAHSVEKSIEKRHCIWHETLQGVLCQVFHIGYLRISQITHRFEFFHCYWPFKILQRIKSVLKSNFTNLIRKYR